MGAAVMIVGPTFFSAPIGDHPPGDGLTLFQTTFAGGSTADVSSAAIGSATIVQPVAGRVEASDGNLRVKLQSADDVSASWTNSSFLILNGVEWTMEVLFSVIGYEPKFTLNRPIGQQAFGSVVSGTLSRTWVAEGLSGGLNLLYTLQSGDYSYGSDLLTANPSPLHHLAFVKRESSGASVDIYHNGQRIGQDKSWLASGSVATISLGGFGSGADRAWFFDFKGVRVRKAQMYPDAASFTPPAGPEAWGPP
jgi:hypothetical protein